MLVEKPAIICQRLTFYKRKQDLEQNGFRLVYIDETWIDTAYTAKRCWQSKDTDSVLSPCNRGQRLIVVHAGSEDGFIPGARLIYKAALSTGDYHNEMNAKNFTKWLEEMLLPNLDGPSAIVMDNTSSHTMQSDKCPTSNTRKANIQVLTQKKSCFKLILVHMYRIKHLSSLSLLVFKYI